MVLLFKRHVSGPRDRRPREDWRTVTDNTQPAKSEKAPPNFPKQAVVVIHGVGEQLPMDTLKAFVRAVWEEDEQITQNGMPDSTRVWTKPDTRSGSLELRRITTRQSIATPTFPAIEGVADSGGVRTDFYELYWADLSAGSTLDQIKTWLLGLLWRNPFKRVPHAVLTAWIALWVLSVATVYFVLAALVTPSMHILIFYPFGWMADWQPWIPAAIGALFGYVGANYVVPYVGRVVRYTRATPDNIAARKEIRQRGLALLEALHDGEYERVIVVGHSLGSILGYDLINYFWATRFASHTFIESTPEFNAFRNLEEALAAYEISNAASDLAKFHHAQRALCQTLRRRPKEDSRWLITDFITLGSPLTYADFLLASDTASLQLRVEMREYSVAPPIREVLDEKFLAPAKSAGLPLSPRDEPKLLSFKYPPANWQMHHAAPFSVVRWTNIYDPARFIFCGDLISGPLKTLFGKAVTDVDLRAIRNSQSWTFTHTKYWELDSAEPVPAHIAELRRALNLAGQIEEV